MLVEQGQRELADAGQPGVECRGETSWQGVTEAKEELMIQMLIETDDEDSGNVKSDDEHDENDKQVLWNNDLETAFAELQL